MKKFAIALFVLFVSSKILPAQDFGFQQKLAQAEKTAKDAADQKINFKSVTTDLLAGRYYQALIKNGIINQTDGELKIKSTIYGLIRIFDSTKREKTYFEKFRWARNIEFGAGMELDKNNKIQSFNPNLTIALHNGREYNSKREKMNLFDKNGMTAYKIEKATEKLDKVQERMAEEVNVISDLTKRKEKKGELDAILDKFNKSDFDFSILSKWLDKEDIKDLETKWTELTKKYDEVQTKLSGAPLLTYGYEGGYNGTKWDKLNNKLEFLLGLGKDTVKKYDFYAGVFYDITQDTLNKSSSLNRNVFTAKIGVNTVLFKNETDGSSIIEVLGGAEYQNIGKGIYTGEKRDFFKLDLTFSFRLAKNLYLPFELKYNATTGRFEGYLDLKFDVVNIFK